MTDEDDNPDGGDYQVGFGKPPLHGRIKKGECRNPRGRPKGRHVRPPHDAVLGQNVSMRINGESRELPADEAILLQVASMGLKGVSGAANALLDALLTVREAMEEPNQLYMVIGGPEDDL